MNFQIFALTVQVLSVGAFWLVFWKLTQVLQHQRECDKVHLERLEDFIRRLKALMEK